MSISNIETDVTMISDEVTEHHVKIPAGVSVAPFAGIGESSYSNVDMEMMLNTLSTLLGRTDIIGYAAARNTRILNAEAQEYLSRREELIMKYGEPQTDEEGNETGVYELKFNTPAFKEYETEIESWAKIRHKPNLFKIPADEVIGKLSGKEILSIDWMLEW